jgi:hypothetical protein
VIEIKSRADFDKFLSDKNKVKLLAIYHKNMKKEIKLM